MERSHLSQPLPAVDLSRFAAARYEGRSGVPARVAVVAARFNEAIVDRLVEGALSTLASAGVADEDVSLVRVPGAWELPVVAARLAKEGQVEAIVALGCVIRGDTSHYEVIVNESARGLMDVARNFAIPVANGVLTCENEAQALARAGGDAGNKGADAALAALEMADLMRRLP
jgi:6,7-dimethyl-8-ribityllumazine synthase